MSKKFRRLVHWLDAEMVGKSVRFIEDEIAQRLDDYALATRKHGIETILGTLQATIDSPALLGGAAATASLSYAADPKWALLGGATVLVGRAAITLARALIDADSTKASTHREIAFVSELQRRTTADSA